MSEKRKDEELEELKAAETIGEVYEIFLKLSKLENGIEAILILNLMSYLNSVNIPTKMFVPLTNSERKIKASIKLLTDNHVINSNQDGTVLSIEESTQSSLRSTAYNAKKEEDCLFRVIPLVFEYGIDDTSGWKDNLDIEHGIAVWEHITKYDNLICLSSALPCHILSKLRKSLKYEEAIIFGKKALEILQKTCGNDHSATLHLQNELGTVMNETGNYNEAFNILAPLMEKKNQLNGDEEAIETMSQVADQLYQLCRYDEALKIYQKIFRNCSLLDKNDDIVLDATHNYTRILYDFGKHEEAIKILKDILKKKSKNLTPDDIKILNLKNGLGNNYLMLKKNTEALKYFQDVYDIRKTTLGEDHLETLRVRNYMGVAYFNQNKFDAALQIYNNVVEKFRKILGNKHPDTLYTLANLASALQGKGQKEKALEIYKEVNKIQSETLGPNHNETLRVKSNIGTLLLDFNKFNEAYEVYTEAYNGFFKTFGPEHPQTIEMKTAMSLLKTFGTNITTIHEIAKKGDLKSIKNLVSNGADVNRKDVFENTPLHYASEYGHVNILKFLLENGAYYSSINKSKKTPLQLAKNNTIKNILGKVTDLFNQVKSGNYEKLEQLMKEEIIINAKEDSGSSALHWAVNKCFMDIVTLLLDNQADPTIKTNKGNTPLHIASSQGFEDIVEILLNHVNKNKLSDFVNATTLSTNTTCVHVAAKNGFFSILKILLKHGAIYDTKNKEGKTALDFAKASKEEDIINFLQLIVKLFEYVKTGDIEIINKLKNLDHDEILAITNTRNGQGKTLLQLAIMNKHKNIANKLTEVLRQSNIKSG